MIDLVVSMKSEINEHSDTACTIEQTIGGTAINVATWAKKAGANPHIIGCVGSDIAGAEIKSHLDDWNISHAVTELAEIPTGMVVALAHLNGERSMFPDSRANSALQLNQFSDLDWQKFSHFYISGYTLINRNTLELALDLMQIAQQHGVKVVLDPASAAPIAERSELEIRRWLEHADILLPNEFEFSALLKVLNCTAAEIQEICPVIAIKAGENGAELRTDSGSQTFSTAKVTVIDSVGAGDAFAGTFIAILSQQGDLETAVKKALENSTNSVTNRGAQPLSH